MPDPRFFYKSESLTLGEIADLSGAEIIRGDKDFIPEDIAPLDKAGPQDLSFLDNIRYKEQFSKSNAGACFVAKELIDIAPAGMALLASSYPYKSYALTAQALYPDHRPEPHISQMANIAPSAKTGKGCVIGNNVVIGENVEIGDQCWLEAGCVIQDNVIIGKGCRIGANSTVSHTLIGDNVRLYPGCQIGQDGFGFAIDPKGHIKVPQLGRVIIEDSVEIGANSCIDRGAGPDTVIGQGTWIDNLVQVGHNVKIGKGCVIVAQVGISGSTIIEDYAVIGGQVGVAGHLKIGSGARIGAQSGIMRDIPAGAEYMGSPAVPMKQFMRQFATLEKLVKNKNKKSS